jgi:hypothetical protein
LFKQILLMLVFAMNSLKQGASTQTNSAPPRLINVAQSALLVQSRDWVATPKTDEQVVSSSIDVRQ